MSHIRPSNTWVDPDDGTVYWNDGREYIAEEDEEETMKIAPVAHRVPARGAAEDKICTLGVCKGKTWDEAKEFILQENDEKWWEGWVTRVTWEVRQFEDVKESE